MLYRVLNQSHCFTFKGKRIILPMALNKCYFLFSDNKKTDEPKNTDDKILKQLKQLGKNFEKLQNKFQQQILKQTGKIKQQLLQKQKASELKLQKALKQNEKALKQNSQKVIKTVLQVKASQVKTPQVKAPQVKLKTFMDYIQFIKKVFTWEFIKKVFKWVAYLFFGTAIYTVGSTFFNFRKDESVITSNEYKQMLEEFGQGKVKIEQGFIPNLSVEKTLQKYIKQVTMLSPEKIFPFIVIYGGQGIGKSEAAKNITNKLRGYIQKNDGKKIPNIINNQNQIQTKQKIKKNQVYYYSLSRKDKKLQPDQIQESYLKSSLQWLLKKAMPQVKNTELNRIYRLKYLLTHIRTKAKKSYYYNMNNNIDSYVIIDDINQLQFLSKIQKIQFADKFKDLQDLGMKVILISSSTSFRSNFWFTTELYKQQDKFQQFVIWEQAKNDYETIIKSKLNSLNLATSQHINAKIYQISVKRGYNLRQISTLFKKIQKVKVQTIEQYEKAIQAFDQKAYRKFKKRLHLSIQKQQASKPQIMLIKRLLKKKMPSTPQQGIKNCQQISSKTTQFGKTLRAAQILHKMDEQNLIIFCYPRTDAYKKYFEDFIKK